MKKFKTSKHYRPKENSLTLLDCFVSPGKRNFYTTLARTSQHHLKPRSGNRAVTQLSQNHPNHGAPNMTSLQEES